MKRNVRNAIICILFAIIPIFFWIGTSLGTNTYTSSFVTMFIPISMYFAIKLFNHNCDKKNVSFIMILSLVLVLYLSLIELPLLLTSVDAVGIIDVTRIIEVYRSFIKEIIIGTLLSVGFMLFGVTVVYFKIKKILEKK